VTTDDRHTHSRTRTKDRLERHKQVVAPVLPEEVLNEAELDTDSFIYNPSLSLNDTTSIASYKTEKSINSRKSRCNALPRRKYADIGQLRPPPGLVLEDVDEASPSASIPKVRRINWSSGHNYIKS
jgi:hypothetical protein